MIIYEVDEVAVWSRQSIYSVVLSYNRATSKLMKLWIDQINALVVTLLSISSLVLGNVNDFSIVDCFLLQNNILCVLPDRVLWLTRQLLMLHYFLNPPGLVSVVIYYSLCYLILLQFFSCAFFTVAC